MNNQQRYIRQMILPGFGNDAQAKLHAAKVCIVGMGGLGCPILQYLVAAGVGYIGIMDADTVSLSNLNRQLLYNEEDISKQKVAIAAARMQQQNAAVQITTYPFALVKENAMDIIESYDLVIDATDNFNAKYLINDVCVLLNKPWIYGAVSKYEGQLTVFNYTPTSVNHTNGSSAIHYRDLFPIPPSLNEIASCEETGVLGVLPGIIGTMQAAEAIKIITGIGNTLYGKLYNYHLLNAGFYEITIQKLAHPTLIDATFFAHTDYTNVCSVDDEEAIDEVDIDEINVAQFMQLQQHPDFFVVDVREKHEYPPIDFAHMHIPMSELATKMQEIPDKSICFICHQGIRSVYAAKQVKLSRNLKVYSLRGGLTAYFK